MHADHRFELAGNKGSKLSVNGRPLRGIFASDQLSFRTARKLDIEGWGVTVKAVLVLLSRVE
jgi:hypothetical protein